MDVGEADVHTSVSLCRKILYLMAVSRCLCALVRLPPAGAERSQSMANAFAMVGDGFPKASSVDRSYCKTQELDGRLTRRSMGGSAASAAGLGDQRLYCRD